jgi:hypothetical protein
MKRIVSVLLILTLSLPPLALAARFAQSPRFHSDARPKKVLLLKPQMLVAELSAGGVVQRMEDWSKQASDNLLQATREYARDSALFETLDPPELSPQTEDLVASHLGLYDLVAGAVFQFGQNSGPDAWADRRTAWEYTLGDGLKALAEQTGADAALVFVGADYISTSGRKAAFVAGLLLGVGIPLGKSFVSAGLVDLKTGDIEWMSFDSSSTMDTREPKKVQGLVKDLFEKYPR